MTESRRLSPAEAGRAAIAAPGAGDEFQPTAVRGRSGSCRTEGRGVPLCSGHPAALNQATGRRCSRSSWSPMPGLCRGRGCGRSRREWGCQRRPFRSKVGSRPFENSAGVPWNRAARERLSLHTLMSRPRCGKPGGTSFGPSVVAREASLYSETLPDCGCGVDDVCAGCLARCRRLCLPVHLSRQPIRRGKPVESPERLRRAGQARRQGSSARPATGRAHGRAAQVRERRGRLADRRRRAGGRRRSAGGQGPERQRG